MNSVVLIGPQRHNPKVSSVLELLGIEGPIAMITAGWQEREPDDEELVQHIGLPAVNLALYGRAQASFNRDETLFEKHRARQTKLRRLQEAYRLRLDYAMDAVHALQQREGRADVYDVEREEAIRAVSDLDAHHLARVSEVHAEYDQELEADTRSVLARHRDELRADLEQCRALLVAGGHVAILLNRMRLFGLSALVKDTPIIAWSAGAMAISERVVLFHDSPPQGAGYAEVLENGLGWAKGIVPLPHAKRRLQLEDKRRVSIFARRFAPASAITLDEGTRITWRDGAWACLQESEARRLDVDGNLVEVAA